VAGRPRSCTLVRWMRALTGDAVPSSVRLILLVVRCTKGVLAVLCCPRLRAPRCRVRLSRIWHGSLCDAGPRGGGVLRCVIRPVLARLPASPVLVGGASSRSQAQWGPFAVLSPRGCCRLGSGVWRVVPRWAAVRPAYGHGLARSVLSGATMVGVRCWCSVEIWSA
jgi:hypothetical protein